MKHCPLCDFNKEESEFFKAKSRKDGLAGICKKCQSSFSRKGKANTDYLRNYYRKHPDRKRKAQLLQNYGLTPERYDFLLKLQNNACAICLSTETKSKRIKFLCVDHDHLTGEVRGLLCANCNRALGLFNDDSSVLTKAAKYLDSKKSK